MLKTVASVASLVAAAALLSSSDASAAPEPPAFTRAGSAVAVENAVPKDPKGLRLLGEGGGTLESTSFKDDRVFFRLDASTAPGGHPVEVEGTFQVTHHRPDGTLVAEFEGRADCLWPEETLP